MPLLHSLTGMALHLIASSTGASTYLQIDDTYYVIPESASIEYVPGGWIVSVTSASACNRRNNQVQQYSDFSLLYGANLDVVYLGTEAGSSSYYAVGSPNDEAVVLAVKSTTGDIVCDGSVAAPDPIFANSFDGP